METIKILVIEVTLFILLKLFINSQIIQIIPECIVYKYLHIYCPSCGGTRCITNILSGNFIQAFKNNSIFFISIIYLMIFNIVYLINLNRKNKILTFIYPKYYHAIIFGILVAIYTIFRNIY